MILIAIIRVTENEKIVDAGVIENTKIKGKVIVIKSDAQDNNLKLQNVVFALKKGNIEVASATTNSEGVATFENIPYGEYKLVEKNSLVNYNLSKREETVNIDTQDKEVRFENWVNQIKRGKVLFTKVDAEDNSKTLDGVVFELRQNGVKKYESTSKNGGHVVFDNVIFGEYDLVETSTLENYNKLSEVAKVNIDEDGKIVNLGMITNKVKRATVKVTKIDSDKRDKKLSMVTFVLKQGEEIKYTAVTNENGVATFTAVEYGDYVLEETRTLENYVLSDKKINVEVREHNKEIDLGEISNRLKKGKVKIVKVDEEDSNKKIENVEFVLKQNGEVKYKGITDMSGVLIFDDVIYGDYILEETKAASGYILSNETKSIKIEEDGKTVDVGEIKNRRNKTNILIPNITPDESKEPDRDSNDTSKPNNSIANNVEEIRQTEVKPNNKLTNAPAKLPKTSISTSYNIILLVISLFGIGILKYKIEE